MKGLKQGKKLIAAFLGAALLFGTVMMPLINKGKQVSGADAAEIDKNIQGPVSNGIPEKIAERPYYAGIISTIQDYGLYRPYFDYTKQNVTGTASTDYYACAGFVGSVLYYGGYGPEITEDFRNWGYDSHNTWTGDKGYIRYGHGSPELLTYYMGHYKYNTGKPATPYYSDAASNKWWKTGDTTKTDWISKWKLASYKVPEKNGGYSISVYNDLVKDYNDGKIAAGDIIVFIQWDSNSSAYFQTSITHIGIIGAPTATYDQDAVKTYLGKDYIAQAELTSLNGATGDTRKKKTVLTTLNVTDNTDWYNQAIGCDPDTDEQYQYHHAAYMPLPCFFDPNGTLGRRKQNPEKTSSVANGYIVYKLNDEVCSEVGVHVYDGETNTDSESGDVVEDDRSIVVDGIADGQRRYGDVDFTVSSPDACMVFLSKDGGETLERLKANLIDGGTGDASDASDVSDISDTPLTATFNFEAKGEKFDIYIVKAGDFNLDGKVDSADALQILRYDVGKLTEITKLQFLAGNIAGDDDELDSADALQILRYDVGKTKFEW